MAQVATRELLAQLGLTISQHEDQSTDGIWWKWDNSWKYIGKLEHVKESEA